MPVYGKQNIPNIIKILDQVMAEKYTSLETAQLCLFSYILFLSISGVLIVACHEYGDAFVSVSHIHRA